MKLHRRQFLQSVAGAASLPAALRIARAQNYPVRPVRIIVGYPAGTAPDIIARLVGQGLSERLAQQFVIDSRPGAATNIAVEVAVKSPPDGYTLLMVGATNAINATLYANLSFNVVHDVAAVASIGGTPFVMVVNSSLPAKTVPEFIAYAKANPGKINMASAGNGTAPHVFGELFKMMADVNMLHVPYRGNYMPDLLSGQVQVMFTAIGTVIEYIRDGKLRALAVTSARRVGALPNVSTMGEFVPGYEASGWLGIGAPKSISTEIIERLNNEINAVITEPNFKVRAVELGVEPFSMTSAQFSQFIVDETKKWATVIKFAGIKPE